MKRKTNPLKDKITWLLVGGAPVVVKTPAERLNAHNIARELGYTIETRRCIGKKCFEIHRTK